MRKEHENHYLLIVNTTLVEKINFLQLMDTIADFQSVSSQSQSSCSSNEMMDSKQHEDGTESLQSQNESSTELLQSKFQEVTIAGE